MISVLGYLCQVKVTITHFLSRFCFSRITLTLNHISLLTEFIKKSVTYQINDFFLLFLSTRGLQSVSIKEDCFHCIYVHLFLFDLFHPLLVQKYKLIQNNQSMKSLHVGIYYCKPIILCDVPYLSQPLLLYINQETHKS